MQHARTSLNRFFDPTLSVLFSLFFNYFGFLSFQISAGLFIVLNYLSIFAAAQT